MFHLSDQGVGLFQHLCHRVAPALDRHVPNLVAFGGYGYVLTYPQ
jgi:hypothetical protein